MKHDALAKARRALVLASLKAFEAELPESLGEALIAHLEGESTAEQLEAIEAEACDSNSLWHEMCLSAVKL